MLSIPQRYRQTDRQTDRRTTYDSNTALALRASRGKNVDFQAFGSYVFGAPQEMRPTLSYMHILFSHFGDILARLSAKKSDRTGSFLGLDSWGVSTSGWGSRLVGLECANAQNSYCEILWGIRRRIPGVLYESWGG